MHKCVTLCLFCKCNSLASQKQDTAPAAHVRQKHNRFILFGADKRLQPLSASLGQFFKEIYEKQICCAVFYAPALVREMTSALCWLLSIVHDSIL